RDLLKCGPAWSARLIGSGMFTSINLSAVVMQSAHLIWISLPVWGCLLCDIRFCGNAWPQTMARQLTGRGVMSGLTTYPGSVSNPLLAWFITAAAHAIPA